MTTDQQIDYIQNEGHKRMTTVKDLIRDYGRQIHQKLSEYSIDSIEASEYLQEMEEEELHEIMKKIRNLFE